MKSTLPIVLVTAGLTLGSTLTVQYFTYRWGISSQIQINITEKRRQALGDLWGRKVLAKELLLSSVTAEVLYYYYGSKWKNDGLRKDSINYQEYQHWRVKYEDLLLETIKSRQGLFETIGLIGVLFPNTPKLNELLERAYYVKAPMISEPPGVTDEKEIQKWKQGAVEGAARFVDAEFEKPIADLLNYLKGEITKDAKNP